MSALDQILEELRAEREYQDTQWGTEFDDRNTLNDWAAYICIYLGRGADIASKDPRKYMKKVAALAIAALEAHDRNGGFAPRHYDKEASEPTQPVNPKRAEDGEPPVPAFDLAGLRSSV